MREKRDRQCRLWLLARALDAEGSGRVDVADLRALIEREKLRGLSRTSLARLLRAGDGVFWHVYQHDGGQWLLLRGLAAVCEALGVERLRYSPVCVPIRWLRTLRAFRSACYGSLFAGEDFGNPISRTTLETLTGYGPRTQRGWQRALGKRIESRQNAAATSKEWERGQEVEDGHFVDYVNGALTVLRRLPNSYVCGFETARRGRMKKVNQRLRIPSSNCGRETRSERLYYADIKAALRRMHQQQEGDLFYFEGAEVRERPATASRGGSFLWSRVQVCDARVFVG